MNVHHAGRMWGAYLLCCVSEIMAAAALDIVWLFAGLLIWLTVLFQGTCWGRGTFIPRQVQVRWRKIISFLLTHKGRTKLVCPGHGMSSGSLVPHLLFVFQTASCCAVQTDFRLLVSSFLSFRAGGRVVCVTTPGTSAINFPSERHESGKWDSHQHRDTGQNHCDKCRKAGTSCQGCYGSPHWE